MLCIKCQLDLPLGMDRCPQCGGELVEDRRAGQRRMSANTPMTADERRESDRRKLFIKRYEEVFLRGPAKGN